MARSKDAPKLPKAWVRLKAGGGGPAGLSSPRDAGAADDASDRVLVAAWAPWASLSACGEGRGALVGGLGRPGAAWMGAMALEVARPTLSFGSSDGTDGAGVGGGAGAESCGGRRG